MKKPGFYTVLCTLICVMSSALASARNIGNTIDDAFSLYRSGNLDEAGKIATLVMDRAVLEADTTTLIKSLCLKTDIAIDKDDGQEAANCYNMCCELSGFGEPMFLLTSSLYNIAMIYCQNQEYEKALEYIVKSISIDSHRDTDAVLAIRYLLAARILYELGRYDEALEYIAAGMEFAAFNNNSNVMGRFVLLKTMCRQAMDGDSPDWEALEQGYIEAYNLVRTRHDGYNYSNVNPYLPEICYHLGLVLDTLGKDARPYLEEAVLIAGSPQKMRGDNPMMVILSCKALAAILEREGNHIEARRYMQIADSLSFVPLINEMSIKLSLNQMEFIRHEKDRQIEIQKSRTVTMVVVASMLAVFMFLIFIMYRKQKRQKMDIEERNAQLVKLIRQKDELIEMIRKEPALSEKSAKVEAIANDKVPLPEINFSKRELEIIGQCCKGLISKEIAANLGISTRTVEAHKCNIFRKIGVSTTNELIAFAFQNSLNSDNS